MIWTYIFSFFALAVCFWLGYIKLFYIHDVTTRSLLLAIILSLSVYSLLMFSFKRGWLAEAIAGTMIACFYAAISGFFLGTAFVQYRNKQKSGKILYSCRSFWSDILPNLVALSLIIIGLHRTAILGEQIITPIRVSSGLSLLSIGVWGWTIRLIPEFRNKGILLLDNLVVWNNLLSYAWYSEEIIEIEYEQNGTIKNFKTLIPLEDRKQVEKMLKTKLLEKDTSNHNS